MSVRWLAIFASVVLVAVYLAFAPAVGYYVNQQAIDRQHDADRRTALNLAALAHQRDVKDCESRNQIRIADRTFWIGLVTQTANMSQATLGSPSSSAEEKRRAREMLAELPPFAAAMKKAFAEEKCPTL